MIFNIYETLRTHWFHPYQWKRNDCKCMHDGCSQCHGTGVKKDGSRCIHMISCRCRKCSPRM